MVFEYAIEILCLTTCISIIIDIKDMGYNYYQPPTLNFPIWNRANICAYQTNQYS